MDQLRSGAKLYHYEGGVMVFDRVAAHHFRADTRAVSIEKARSNIKYQFRKKGNLGNRTPVTLVGKLTLVDE